MREVAGCSRLVSRRISYVCVHSLTAAAPRRKRGRRALTNRNYSGGEITAPQGAYLWSPPGHIIFLCRYPPNARFAFWATAMSFGEDSDKAGWALCITRLTDSGVGTVP